MEGGEDLGERKAATPICQGQVLGTDCSGSHHLPRDLAQETQPWVLAFSPVRWGQLEFLPIELGWVITCSMVSINVAVLCYCRVEVGV